eukprot:914296-Pelagomonas_calceolata.AAC.1
MAPAHHQQALHLRCWGSLPAKTNKKTNTKANSFKIPSLGPSYPTFTPLSKNGHMSPKRKWPLPWTITLTTATTGALIPTTFGLVPTTILSPPDFL